MINHVRTFSKRTYNAQILSEKQSKILRKQVTLTWLQKCADVFIIGDAVMFRMNKSNLFSCSKVIIELSSIS